MPALLRMPGRPAPRPPTARLRVLLAGLAASLAMSGCGGGGGGDTAAAPASTGPGEVAWVESVMKGLYLYADRVGSPDLSGVQTAAGALEALRVNPPDRFSYVEARAAYDGFFDEGRAVGLGIAYRIVGDGVVLRLVQPDSPAARAGLRRGDRIVAIGGVATATLVAASGVSAAFGAATAGVGVRLAWERDGRRAEAAIVKDTYTVSPVLATRMIERGGAKVGYVALYTFTEPTRQAWADAVASLRDAGARSIVVDLRENGGGRLFVAAAVAGSLAPAGAAGEVFTTLRYNARNAASNQTIAVPADASAGRIDKVAWLVSESTCSASESLIAGLRPFRADAVIGTPTCGKPVGFNPQTRGDVVLSAVSFASRNRDGLGEWFDGLAPTCSVVAEPYLAFGDEADPRLAEALHWIATGACSAAAATAPKSAGPMPAHEAVRGMASETGLH